MRLMSAISAGVLALTGGVANAASVEIRDAVARVVVIPEDRADIKVEMLASHPSLPLQVRTAAGRTIIDGDLDRRIRDCNGSGESASVRVNGIGQVRYAEMPQVVVRTPRDVQVSAGGAVFGAIGKSNALELNNAGCGAWTVANVAGRLKVTEAGSGDIATGASGQLVVRIAGSGDIRAQAVAGGADIDVVGSGDVWVASISGPLEARIAGSGDVRVAAGKAPQVNASIVGSGDIRFDGEAGDVKASIAGSGDVHIGSATGKVSKSVMGSGGVTIG